MATCKRCGREIGFAKTCAGKWMPIEPGGVYYRPDDDGELLVLDDQGELIRGHESYGSEVEGIHIGYVPHWQRCKQGEAERKRQQKKRWEAKRAQQREQEKRAKEREEAAMQEAIRKRKIAEAAGRQIGMWRWLYKDGKL